MPIDDRQRRRHEVSGTRSSRRTSARGRALPRPTDRAPAPDGHTGRGSARHSEREGQRNRHVREQNAADGRHPQHRRGVATRVAHVEHPERQAEEDEHDERREHRRDAGRKPRERNEQRGRAAADTRTPSDPRGSDRRAADMARRPSSTASAAGRYAKRTSHASRPSCALNAIAPTTTTTAKNTSTAVTQARSRGRPPLVRWTTIRRRRRPTSPPDDGRHRGGRGHPIVEPCLSVGLDRNPPFGWLSAARELPTLCRPRIDPRREPIRQGAARPSPTMGGTSK